ncbi:2-amino-4-hydroxy-6-hydroxymethyldihydropteridine diphosphokinase [Rubeoparvulum massiliense]|uniref:2-amino-4-hydroxy-6- hydroxymethyldihydropteridine diphosphokinase n=1 Tax=Rubeoparvulum massiliense TaxID=1631346 RepID=UPI00065E18E6|nr:2-amino-4-hydroxy-6-hydroxymethyldihydropteridine diphosphokinase [Rubeoparvulum massiliense]
MEQWIDAYVALGSNIDNREIHLEEAIEHLVMNPHVSLVETSAIYETDPVGVLDQSAFLNMAIHIKTTLSAQQLLHEMQMIEDKLGRERTVHWGPRTIDLDLLMYGEEEIEEENLIVPHPRMAERLFVLIPLADIGESLQIPGIQQTVKERIDHCLAQGCKKDSVRLYR